jgi:hypothetical protein
LQPLILVNALANAKTCFSFEEPHIPGWCLGTQKGEKAKTNK